MPYAIVGYFDPDTDKKIKAIWKTFADTGLSGYLHESENDPHIKFAMYESIGTDNALKCLEAFTGRFTKPDLHFKNYGIYPGDKPILFLDLSATLQMLELQLEVKTAFSPWGEEAKVNFFDQGIWKPDCFLTNAMDKADVDQAIRILYNTQLPFNGYLTSLGLISFYPARQIGRFALQDKGTVTGGGTTTGQNPGLD